MELSNAMPVKEKVICSCQPPNQKPIDRKKEMQHKTPKQIRNRYESVNAYESVNGGRQLRANLRLNWPPINSIFELKKCDSHDSPKQIAYLLGKIFEPWPSKEGHWLWIAQTYTARTINWVMAKTQKEYLRGAIRKTPAAYFTYQFRHRKKRKEFRK